LKKIKTKNKIELHLKSVFYKEMNNTQLTSASGYKVQNLVFAKPNASNVPNSNPPIKYYRINVKTKNADGTIGDLVFPTESCFSFGVSENKDQQTQKVNGHTFSLTLWGREGPSPAQKEWLETFNAVVESCKKHVLVVREEIAKHDLEKSDLKKFNPLYYKRVDGKIVDDRGPTLYPKLIESKKENKILTKFYDQQDDKEIEPFDLKGKRCNTKAAVKIESIYVGDKIKLQVKLYEAYVDVIESSAKKLLSRPVGESKLKIAQNPFENNDTNSIQGSDDDREPQGSLLRKEPEEEVVEAPSSLKKEKKKERKVKTVAADD